MGLFAKAKSMQIHLSPRHLRLSASIHAHAAGVMASLEDYTEIFAAHLVLMHDEAAKPPDRFVVKAHVAIVARMCTQRARQKHSTLPWIWLVTSSPANFESGRLS
jgi:hypothetical protein